MFLSWQKNIKLSIRIKIWIRDNYLKKIYNPYQIIRRKFGLAQKDLFKHVLLQTNYRCTRKCSFCHYGLAESPNNVDINEDLFYNIIDELKKLDYKGRIGLFEMNEPLTDRRFVKFLSYTRKKLPKAWIFISSNGDLLNVSKAIELFEKGLNFIYLSSYDLKALERNLQLLEELPKKYSKLINHLNRTYQTDWTSRGGNVEKYKKKMINNPCDMIYRVMYVKPTGKVHSCYNDFYDINIMGDLKKQSITEVWYGEKYNKLRETLDNKHRELNKLCSGCEYIGYGNLPKIPISWKLRNYKFCNKV